MNIKNSISLIIVAFFASVIRLLINNIFLTSLVGSFVFGFIISRKYSQSVKTILISGFCASFTSFSGFIYSLHKLIIQENLIIIFVYLNTIIILNLLMMHCGSLMSRKIT